MIKGIPASNGIGMAKVLYIKKIDLEIKKVLISPENAEEEISRLHEATVLSHNQLNALYEDVKATLGNDAEIIKAQISMLTDPAISAEVQTHIRTDYFNAEYAVSFVLDQHIAILSAVEDEYIKERAADLADIKTRLLHNLTGTPVGLLINEEAIIVCDTLTPSETVNFSPQYVKGIICESGGVTSHAAIIARSLGIPAIMGCKDINLSNGDIVFINGSKGEAFLIKDAQEMQQMRIEIEKAAVIKAGLSTTGDIPAITADGKQVDLLENVGEIKEYKNLGNGIGLFRTEFLYMQGKKTPSEDSQFMAYKQTVERLAGKKLVFRTFDIGGDKEVPYLQIPKEDNPFLGWRAVRICLDEPEMFKTQLRALLRASAFGELKIMIPMISSLTELRAVRKIFDEVKSELKQKETAFDESTPLGIMIEIPSAALCAQALADESDFFSIGTNDLIQYTTAVDRGNEKVSAYYNFFNPAVLKLVKMTIDAAHKAGKTTGMCGEAAGDPLATILLLGMGLDSFSVSPSLLPKIKKIISHIDMKFAKEAACATMKMDTPQEIKNYLMGILKDMNLDYLVSL